MINDMIKSIGIEMECGIHTSKIAMLQKKYGDNCVAEYDSSVGVRHDEKCTSACTKSWSSDREITFWSEDKKQFFQFIKDMFRVGIKQNSSCGNHIHLVFANQEKAVSMFSFPAYMRKFTRAYAKKFAGNDKYMFRLRNHYCTERITPKQIITQLDNHSKNSARYHSINLNSYNLYGTIEIRILPYASTATELIKSIEWVIDTVSKMMATRGYQGELVKNSCFEEVKRNVARRTRNLDKTIYIQEPEVEHEIIIKRSVSNV